MIAYPVQVEDAMLIVPVNLPSFEVPAVPPQTASSSPSTTGNTRRDGPYERFNMRPLPRSFGAFRTAAPSAPAGQRAAHATEHRHQAAKRWAKRTAGRRYDSPVQAKAAESLLAFAEQTVPGLRGLDGKAISAKIEQRYRELLGALGWFVDERRTDEALRLASSLAPFWMATKRLEEGSEWSDRALASPDGTDAARGETLQAGLLAFWRGDDDRAFALHHQALAIGRRIGDPTVTAKALTGRARIALRRTGVDEARRLCHEALAITEGTADRTGRSNALHVLGVTAQMVGEFLEARKLMSERIALAREAGNYATIGLEASNLAMVERQLGNLDQAEALSREALDISYRRGD